VPVLPLGSRPRCRARVREDGLVPVLAGRGRYARHNGLSLGGCAVPCTA